MWVGRCYKHGEYNAGIAASCPKCLEAIRAHGSARAQLWTSVYASQFDASMRHQQCHESAARSCAKQSADAAVRDFDEHYCTKGTP